MTREQRSFRTHGIIIKRRDFGEADRLVTIITPQHGKLDVIAKGARKPTSAKTGHVELFTRADMLVHRGRDFGILTQSQMLESYLPLRENLERGAYANYAGELLDRFTIEGDDDLKPMYDHLDTTLTRLCTTSDPRLVIRYFELHLLDFAGFRPELQECVFTHDPLQPEDQFFSYAEGGVVSLHAAKHGTSLVPISLDSLKLLRHLQRSSFEKVALLQISTSLHNDLERLMLGYIIHLLERRLQSVDFIRRIRR